MRKVIISRKIHHPCDPLVVRTIVIYTCVMTRDTRINSGEEYCFIKY